MEDESGRIGDTDVTQRLTTESNRRSGDSCFGRAEDNCFGIRGIQVSGMRFMRSVPLARASTVPVASVRPRAAGHRRGLECGHPSLTSGKIIMIHRNRCQQCC